MVSGAVPYGRITSGIPAETAALKTLDFIASHLAAWRDDPERPVGERERHLNPQLCKFLNVAANRSGFAMVHFNHEEPQGDRHSADFSANPADAGWIEGLQYTKYEPILVMEGKRLPTPGTGREREYVTSPPGEKPGGGVQRFKLGLHAASLPIAGMVGYVQAKTCGDWFPEVNRWIEDLAASGTVDWSRDDRLMHFAYDSASGVSRCESRHQRETAIVLPIRLTHLWVEMNRLQ
ncbi:MAG: hypothetical protein ACKV0T_26620 [Planctomycetales bacterium]